MSVVLRHKKFPFIMVYSDSRESWDSDIKKMLLEEIDDSEFDKFVEESSVPPLFQKLFNPIETSDMSKSQARRIKHGLKKDK